MCPQCGRLVKSRSRFCPSCGVPLTASSPKEGRQGPRCPNCGALARTGARFCRKCSHPLTDQRPDPPQGPFGTGALLPLTELVNRYVILKKVAQGGMGAIYKAQDKHLQDKIVAIKEMSESAIAPADREQVVKAFHREAELLARLDHPNLVRVTNRFQNDDRHFMVMEFVPGQTLDDMLKAQKAKGEPFPEKQVLVWADQLCDVLAFLHNQDPKIIYRDVKPANVMVVDDTNIVKLIDFGITRFYKPGKKKDTIEFGTDGYAPPEQYGKAQTDERADVYALGVTLHELLTLHDPTTKLFDFPPVRQLNSQVSRRVEKAIAKATNPSRDARYQSMEELQSDLIGTTPPNQESPEDGFPPTLYFGNVLPGTPAPSQILELTPPTNKKVKLSTPAAWLDIDPQSVSKKKKKVTISLRPHHLNPGRLELSGGWLKRWVNRHTSRLVPTTKELHTTIEIQIENGPTKHISVEAKAVPRQWRKYAGWLGTGLLMLVEALAILTPIVAVIISLCIY